MVYDIVLPTVLSIWRYQISLGKLSLLPKAGTLTGANAGGYDMGVFKLNSAAVQQWVVQRGSAGTEQAGFVGQKIRSATEKAQNGRSLQKWSNGDVISE